VSNVISAMRPRAARGAGLVVLLVFCAFFLLPIVWLLLAPTKSDFALQQHSPFAFGSFHQVAVTWHHVMGFNDGALLVWLRNSLYYSVAAVAITLAFSIPAGYALAVTEFAGRKLLLATTMIVMILPNAALVLPTFLEMNALHLIGKSASVILPFSFFPFGVYLAYLYYSTAVPRELLEAAQVDGAGEWQVFRRIALPLAMPVVGLVAFFAFVNDWNNYFLPFVMLGDDRQYPLPVGLNQLLASTPAFNPTLGGTQVHILRPELALATAFAAAPVAIVLLLSQRHLVRGLMAGASVG
jgi:multiple sugar transport system permease protein